MHVHSNILKHSHRIAANVRRTCELPEKRLHGHGCMRIAAGMQRLLMACEVPEAEVHEAEAEACKRFTWADFGTHACT